MRSCRKRLPRGASRRDGSRRMRRRTSGAPVQAARPREQEDPAGAAPNLLEFNSKKRIEGKEKRGGGLPVRRRRRRSSPPVCHRAAARTLSPRTMAGRSGYPKISGWVVRVSGISGFQKCYPKLAGEKKNPKIRVPENSGSGLPEQPELTTQRWQWRRAGRTCAATGGLLGVGRGGGGGRRAPRRWARRRRRPAGS